MVKDVGKDLSNFNDFLSQELKNMFVFIDSKEHILTDNAAVSETEAL